MDKDLILSLNRLCIKFGQFKLKSGIMSPLYVDLRNIISEPNLLNILSDMIWQNISSQNVEANLIAGVPYTALPIATVISSKFNIPMIIKRKEAKEYGTKKLIEGVFKAGDKCIIVDDIITSGQSIIETIQALEYENIKVEHIVILVDREQGGKNFIQQKGYNITCLLKMSEILQFLRSENQITEELYQDVNQFLSNTKVQGHQANQTENAQKPEVLKQLTYEERSHIVQGQLSKKICRLMVEKKSNLAFSADVSNKQQLLNMLDQVGPEIIIVKTHCDIIEGFDQEFVKQLLALAQKHNFLIFEDRKFADIGSVVQSQFSGGCHQISSWADIIDAHVVTGPGIIQSLKQESQKLDKLDSQGLLLIGQLSSTDNLINSEYTKNAIEFGQKYADFVIGFICQGRLADDKFLYLTPGVNVDFQSDSLDQNYNSPEYIICNKKSDIIIVGRGIYSSKDPQDSAKKYRSLGWEAYLKRLENNQ